MVEAARILPSKIVIVIIIMMITIIMIMIAMIIVIMVIIIIIMIIIIIIIIMIMIMLTFNYIPPHDVHFTFLQTVVAININIFNTNTYIINNVCLRFSSSLFPICESSFNGGKGH